MVHPPCKSRRRPRSNFEPLCRAWQRRLPERVKTDASFLLYIKGLKIRDAGHGFYPDKAKINILCYTSHFSIGLFYTPAVSPFFSVASLIICRHMTPTIPPPRSSLFHAALFQKRCSAFTENMRRFFRKPAALFRSPYRASAGRGRALRRKPRGIPPEGAPLSLPSASPCGRRGSG